ncbi:uracil-DNA glycosylase [Allohahella marinimesophila]|uniref:Uracil-DNA glycosylase n=1 Tax=Allohahella marinimesophila TaxID=1054972 RepID=A0ABP7Q4E5_9GAMM
MGFLHEALSLQAPGYEPHLRQVLSQDSSRALENFLIAEEQQGKLIYPAFDNCFAALRHSPFDTTRVVILGQDPYHGPGQAHGLSFSVPPGVAVPPSLRNIYKELGSDLGLKPDAGFGCLESWADQGVLLLNAVLTVEGGQAASHAGRGWEPVTDAIVTALNEHRSGLVFLLWGSYAQKKAAAVDTTRHLVLKAPHPSPLSAHRGFLGCRHFSAANEYIERKGGRAIDWLPRQE